jgi:hypothetical protein
LKIEISQERVEDVMQRFGYTEPEARVAIHLGEAENLLTELEREAYSGPKIAHYVWRETHLRENFKALRKVLGIRVLRRDYPEGWGHVPPKEEEENDKD